MKQRIAILSAVLMLASPAAALSSTGTGGYQVAANTGTASAISGRVVDAQTNNPLAGVKVTAYRIGFTQVQASAMTDSQGQFTLNGLTGGDYRLLFERSGLSAIARSRHRRQTARSFGAGRARSHCSRKLEDAAVACRSIRAASLLQPGQVADVYVICSGH